MFNRSLAVGAFAVLIGTAGFAAAQQPDKHNPYKKHDSKNTPTQPTTTTSETKKPDVTLKVGDPAPALKVDKWVKGDQVSSFQPGKVYVVEFWATWCNPCKEAIPHLTELQHKFKDVAFIGVASSEHDPKPNQPDKRQEELSKFVSTMGSKMDYRVAYDEKHSMNASWLAAAGQNTIPTAFIVDGSGKIAYVGSPTHMADKLADVVKANTPKPTDATKPAENPKNSTKTTPTKK